MSGPLRFPESTKSINKVVLNGDIKIDLTGDTVQPYNLFKEVKELIKNDDDDIFFEKIKRIDKILELKN